MSETTESLRRERDEARAVLADYLTERGASSADVLAANAGWLLEVARRRDEVLGRIRSARSPVRCCTTVSETAFNHGPACSLAWVLRLIGGPEEVQRQVDAAWDEALRIAPDSIRLGPDGHRAAQRAGRVGGPARSRPCAECGRTPNPTQPACSYMPARGVWICFECGHG